MRLSEVVPLAQIEATLQEELLLERVDSADWKDLAKRDPESCYGIAGRAWHLQVSKPSSRINPQALAKYFDAQDSALAGAVERVTGKPILKEFGFLEATVPHNEERFVVATSVVAHLTAGELLLYDIGLANPRLPVKPAKRVSPSQYHNGYGLLGDVISSVEIAAKERSCSTVSLVAAYKPLVPIFQRFGFQVETHPLAQMGMRLGVSIPMIKRV